MTSDKITEYSVASLIFALRDAIETAETLMRDIHNGDATPEDAAITYQQILASIPS